MPIPFRDADDVAQFGSAGFLKIDARPEENRFLGALFQMNARGEPLEFSYNRVDVPNTFLWRADDLQRSAVQSLVTSLFSVAPKPPTLLLCLAKEIHPELFSKQLHIAVPVCRIAPLSSATPYLPLEAKESFGEQIQHQVFWFPGKPPDESLERRLMNRLVDGGFLLEPFERALVGLREVFSQPPAGA